VGWHIEGALDAGQPEENASSHIGLFLGWLIRRDMFNPEFFADRWVDAIKQGEMTGSEALNTVDDKLVSDLMTAQGAAFTGWYYEKYLDDFAATFPGLPDYAVTDEPSAQTQVEQLLDRRFGEWVDAGQPKAPVRSAEDLADKAGLVPEPYGVMFPPREEWGKFSAEAREMLERDLAEAQERGWTIFEPPPAPHEAPELEAMIPAEPYRWASLSSTTAAKWQHAVLNRSLKRLGVKPTRAIVANAVGSIGDERGLAVNLTSVPGIDARRLEDEFEFVWESPPGQGRKSVREVDGRPVHWVNRPDWQQGWWTRDELVVMATAPDDDTLTELILRLP
jgi:hypothetical protein